MNDGRAPAPLRVDVQHPHVETVFGLALDLDADGLDVALGDDDGCFASDSGEPRSVDPSMDCRGASWWGAPDLPQPCTSFTTSRATRTMASVVMSNFR